MIEIKNVTLDSKKDGNIDRKRDKRIDEIKHFFYTDDTEIILTNGDRIFWKDTDAVLRFTGQRDVISTSPLNGGIRKDLRGIFNHCDVDWKTGFCEMRGNTYEEHLSYVAADNGMSREECTGLSTACSIDRMRISQCVVDGITVTVLITAGINKNGRCAGDPATLWEENGIFHIIPEEKTEAEAPPQGTINIILHVDAALSPAALAGAIMVATEAKVAAVRDLQVPSCYSDDYATGSGTDGVIVISNPESRRYFTQFRTDTQLAGWTAYMIRDTLTETIIASMKEN